MKNKNKAIWSTRFNNATSKAFEKIGSSINIDKRLFEEDILGSIVHSQMLIKQKIINKKKGHKIINGLKKIRSEIRRRKFIFNNKYEDIHLNIEKRLFAIIGEDAGYLHIARSRNDQVITDFKLWIKKASKEVIKNLNILIKSFLKKSEVNIQTIMPGFTHLKNAQPISFSHYLLAYVEMFKRDKKRFISNMDYIDECPLGVGALAGTSYPIDRQYVAKLLKFDSVMANSIDAVSDRDFLIEFNFDASLLMTHLSRWSEELIMWSSPFFGFIEIPDRFCTGSSIMPQKKNPDVPELVRGKVARVNGHLVSLLTLMKAQPLAYNKDNQEDKEPVFDVADTISDTLNIFAEMVADLKVSKESMEAAAFKGYSTATDLADYLVKKGMPFREAHGVVAKAVKYAIAQECDLSELDLEVLQKFSGSIDQSVFKYLTLKGSVQSRNHFGGTSFTAVKSALKKAHQKLA